MNLIVFYIPGMDLLDCPPLIKIREIMNSLLQNRPDCVEDNYVNRKRSIEAHLPSAIIHKAEIHLGV